MDADSRANNPRIYYKNLAKQQKKRWRSRRNMKRKEDRMKRRSEFERRRAEHVPDVIVEDDSNDHGLPEKFLEATAHVPAAKEDDPKREEREDNLYIARKEIEKPMELEEPREKQQKQPNLTPHCHNFKEINTSSLVKIGKSIGAGTFGQCNLARYRGMIVAVKDYIADNFSNKQQLKQEVMHEAHVISQLGDHCNLPLLYGICTTSLPYKMVLQYHGIGEKSLTIHKAIKTKQLKNEQWFHIVKGVAAGLSHVHAKGYLHNDLKANNVVIENSEGEYNSILIDFGKSSKIGGNVKRKRLSKEEQLSYSSSYPHIAPEIVDGSNGPSIKSDVFSFGKLMQYIEIHSSFEVGGRINSMACSAALLQSPKMRPSLKQIINYDM